MKQSMLIQMHAIIGVSSSLTKSTLSMAHKPALGRLHIHINDGYNDEYIRATETGGQKSAGLADSGRAGNTA
jgi:hypothetical protein